jgi:ectoine hydroxylase
MTTNTALIPEATEALESIDRHGYVVLGTLDPAFTDRLRSAADEVATRWAERAPNGQLHLLSCLEHHPDLVEVIDWTPLLEVLTAGLSWNIHVNHSHIDIHPPHPPTDGRRWHRDGGVQGRDMRLMPAFQPRLALKVGVFLTGVDQPDDGALELVPGSHLDSASRPTSQDPEDAVAVVVPAGSVVVIDARIWHRRRDNLGTLTRKARFLNYTYRWIASRECRFQDVPTWQDLSGVRQQLLGGSTLDPFYPAAGALPLEQHTAHAALRVPAGQRQRRPQS